MFKKDNVFAKADEKFVKVVKLYAADTVLWYDPEFNNAVLKKDIEDLFLKGIVIVLENGSMVKPVSIMDGDIKDADSNTYTASEPEELG